MLSASSPKTRDKKALRTSSTASGGTYLGRPLASTKGEPKGQPLPNGLTKVKRQRAGGAEKKETAPAAEEQRQS